MTQPSEKTKKVLDIDFLYLDLGVCNPCQGTEAILDQAVSDVSPILEEVGFEITLHKTHVQTLEQARDLAFVSSPTIRINGCDIQPEVSEKQCISCGDLCGNPDVCCRVWTYKGEQSWAPPKALIIDAILSNAYGDSEEMVVSTVRTEDVPENIKLFFAAKEASELKGSDACCDSSTPSNCCSPSKCCPQVNTIEGLTSSTIQDCYIFIPGAKVLAKYGFVLQCLSRWQVCSNLTVNTNSVQSNTIFVQ